MIRHWYVDNRHTIGVDYSTMTLIASGPNALDLAVREADSWGYRLVPPRGTNVREAIERGWPVALTRREWGE